MKTNELYHRAIETYGIRNQWAVAVEELAELQKEICKMLRGGGDIAHLAEEIADAKIMIEQLIIIFTEYYVARWNKDHPDKPVQVRFTEATGRIDCFISSKGMENSSIVLTATTTRPTIEHLSTASGKDFVRTSMQPSFRAAAEERTIFTLPGLVWTGLAGNCRSQFTTRRSDNGKRNAEGYSS